MTKLITQKLEPGEDNNDNDDIDMEQLGDTRFLELFRCGQIPKIDADTLTSSPAEVTSISTELISGQTSGQTTDARIQEYNAETPTVCHDNGTQTIESPLNKDLDNFTKKEFR